MSVSAGHSDIYGDLTPTSFYMMRKWLDVRLRQIIPIITDDKSRSNMRQESDTVRLDLSVVNPSKPAICKLS